MNESDSGGTVRIEAAREALHGVVDELDDELDVGLRVFSSEITDSDAPAACEDSVLAHEIGDNDHDVLRDAIDEYDAVGARTPISYALEAAAEDLGDDGNRTIVLVSDGEENCVPDPCEVAQSIAGRGVDIAMHTVGYNVNSAAREQLQCIADQGNGEYFDAEDVESLSGTLQRLSLRAFQPFPVQGEEITGSTEIEDAPILESGQYIDQWSEEPLYYRIPRNAEGSSVHVGISAIHRDEATFAPLTIAMGTADVQNWDTYQGGSYSTNRELCAQNNLYEGASDASIRVRSSQITVFPGGEHEDCDDAEELILQVEAVDAASDDTYVGEPFELIVEEERPVTNLEELPETAAGSISDYQWQELTMDTDNGQDLLGGNSFNNAAELEPGSTYSSELYPGETLLYWVPVEWGEHLQVQLETAPRQEWDPDGVDRGLQVQLYSPHRGPIDQPTTAAEQEHRNYGTTSFNDPTVFQNMTHPIRWNNRDTPSTGHNDMEFASHAGGYYVMISQSDRSSDDPTAMPFHLIAETFGDLEGAPIYGESADDESVGESPTATDEGTGDESRPFDAGASDEPTSTEEDAIDGALAAESSSSGPPYLAILALALIGAALLTSGGFLLARFIRSNRAA